MADVTKVSVTWDAVSGADKFTAYIATDGQGSGKKALPTDIKGDAVSADLAASDITAAISTITAGAACGVGLSVTVGGVESDINWKAVDAAPKPPTPPTVKTGVWA
ncbi:hypothetical protein O1L55_20725 [Streptomyces albulus]|nr:hypothetical protein [Streptomyces noursei]